MAAYMYRPRNFRGNRSLHRRRDSEEENVHLDFSKPPQEIVREILINVIRRSDVSKAKKLGYLNCFPKLCKQLDKTASLGFKLDEIFCCLRVALFHDACEVRAAGLRAIRYLLRDIEAVETLCRLQLPCLIARCLDIVLDNRLERLQALRLVRRMMAVHPLHFPRALTSCLVAIARDGAQERDTLFRSCLATLGELALFNPSVCAEVGGLNAILRGVLNDYQQPQCGEALLGVILYLLNNPKTRHLAEQDIDLEIILAPLTDCHFCFSSETAENAISDDRENRIVASRMAIASALHSWPGLIYLCRPGATGLQSMIDMLHLPYMDIRNTIMDLLYDVFCLPVPESTDKFELAILSTDPSTLQESWQLYDGFVAAEGKAILPHIAKHRANLAENFLALLLLVFANAGVLEGLVEVIISSDSRLSVKATVLLGEFLYLASRYLPSDYSHKCLCLPSLMTYVATTVTSPERRKKANEAVSCLHHIHSLKKRGPVPCSLFLDQLLQTCSPWAKKSGFVDAFASRSKLRQCLRKDTELTMLAIKNTQVLTLEHTSWDWDLITSILRWPGDNLKKLEDNTHKLFVRKLLVFYKPQSKLFSLMDLEKEGSRLVCIAGCHFLDFLLEADETRSFDILDEFLTDLKIALSEITVETAPVSALFSPSRMVSSVCQTYFLFIGRLSSSSKGRRLLERAGVFQYLLDLVTITSHDTYTKLIVSSLDYSKDDFCRKVLIKVLTSGTESSRLYATNYLRVLLRAKIVDFKKWALELLVTQLYDDCKAVSLAAADILDEACDNQEILEALLALRPSIIHTGDKGLLLLLRFLSIANGFHFLRDSNFLEHEIDRWKRVYNLKYVKIVEDLLNEGLTRHQKGEDGTYGRRSSNTRHQMKPAFVPPHMYGQLAQHSDGLEFLKESVSLHDLYKCIQTADTSTDSAVLHLKAALWAIGHIGSTSLGFSEVYDSGIIPHIIQVASSCLVLSLRGTCFYVLGLLSTTASGAKVLLSFGWETIKHDHETKWPLVKVLVDITNAMPLVVMRPHAWSASSTDSRFSDYFTDSDALFGSSFASKVGFFIGSGSDRDSVSGMSDSDHRLNVISPFGSYTACLDNPSPQMVTFHSQTLPRGAGLLPHQPYHHRSMSDTRTMMEVLRPRSSSDSKSTEPASRHMEVIYSSANPVWSSDGTNNHSSVMMPATCEQEVALSDSRDSGTGEEPPESLSSSKQASEDLPVGATSTTVAQGEVVCTPVAPSSKGERSDSNESSQTTSSKSRSDSYPESSTSGVSSCDSGPCRAMQHEDHVHKLSPIASSSSLNTMVGRTSISSYEGTHWSHVYGRQFSFGGISWKGLPGLSPTSPDSAPSPVFTFTTARNELGYKVQSAIQRRRVQSLSLDEEDDGSIYGVSPESRFHKARSLDRYLGASLRLRDRDGIGTRNSSRRSSLASNPSEATTSKGRNIEPPEEEPRFIGLCLPMDMCLLFCVMDSKMEEDTLTKISDTTAGPPPPIKDHPVFENWEQFHKSSSCILCCTTITPCTIKIDALKEVSLSEPPTSISCNQSVTQLVAGGLESPILSMRKSRTNSIDSNIAATTGSVTSTGSLESGNTRSSEESELLSLVLVRKEVMRFVSNLSSSVAIKATEQGLLNLKQKFPQAFQDICLYSEVSFQMEKYSFRLTARRFLQELFLDMTFEQLFQEAETILRLYPHKLTLPVSPESEV